MEIKKDSIRDLIKFYEVYGKKILDWLEYKANVFQDDPESMKLLNKYKKLNQIAIILIILAFISLFLTFFLAIVIMNYLFFITAIQLLFFVTVPSFIFSFKNRYNAIRLLMDVFQEYLDAPIAEKREQIGNSQKYILKYSKQLLEESESSIYNIKIVASETLRNSFFLSLTTYFLLFLFFIFLFMMAKNDGLKNIDKLFTDFIPYYSNFRSLNFGSLVIFYRIYYVLYDTTLMNELSHLLITHLLFIPILLLIIGYFFYIILNIKKIIISSIILNSLMIIAFILIDYINLARISENLFVFLLYFFFLLIIYPESLYAFLIEPFKIEIHSKLKQHIENYLKNNNKIELIRWNWFFNKKGVINFRIEHLATAFNQNLINDCKFDRDKLVIYKQHENMKEPISELEIGKSTERLRAALKEIKCSKLTPSRIEIIIIIGTALISAAAPLLLMSFSFDIKLLFNSPLIFLIIFFFIILALGIFLIIIGIKKAKENKKLPDSMNHSSRNILLYCGSVI
ncbi:MAG: hypothetical protein ACTSRG_02125 [Candidatus Helarchaeota archaeon]